MLQGSQIVVTEDHMTDQCEEESSKSIKGCSLVEATTWGKLPLPEAGQSSLNEDVKKSPTLGKGWLTALVH